MSADRPLRRLHVNLGGVLDPSEVIGRDDLFRRAAAGAGPGGLVLIIDEIPILARALEEHATGGGAALLHLLRRARQDNGDLSMVLSGSIGFHHVVSDHTVVNDVDKIHVGPISEDDATHLAACLLLGEQVPTDDAPALATTIGGAAESVPYYVHHLVDDLRNVATRRGASVNADDVAPLIAAALIEPDDPWDLRHYRDRLPGYYQDDAPLAAAVLDAFAATDDLLSVDQVLRALAVVEDIEVPGRDDLVHLVEKLESDHYLVREGDGDRFSSDLLRQAWRRFRR